MNNAGTRCDSHVQHGNRDNHGYTRVACSNDGRGDGGGAGARGDHDTARTEPMRCRRQVLPVRQPRVKITVVS